MSTSNENMEAAVEFVPASELTSSVSALSSVKRDPDGFSKRMKAYGKAFSEVKGAKENC